MTKSGSLIAAVSMALALSACGGGDSTASSSSSTTTTEAAAPINEQDVMKANRLIEETCIYGTGGRFGIPESEASGNIEVGVQALSENLQLDPNAVLTDLRGSPTLQEVVEDRVAQLEKCDPAGAAELQAALDAAP